MSRRSVIGSSEQARAEVVYRSLAVKELERRISGYERKYGSPLESYAARVSCDSASGRELSELMDWENLVEELKFRRPSSIKVR